MDPDEVTWEGRVVGGGGGGVAVGNRSKKLKYE